MWFANEFREHAPLYAASRMQPSGHKPANVCSHLVDRARDDQQGGEHHQMVSAIYRCIEAVNRQSP
jgi:thioesterase domain-containing protein